MPMWVQCALLPANILAAALTMAASAVDPLPSTAPVSSSTLYCCMRSSVVGCNHGSKRAAETCSGENYVHQRRHSAARAKAGDAGLVTYHLRRPPALSRPRLAWRGASGRLALPTPPGAGPTRWDGSVVSSLHS